MARETAYAREVRAELDHKFPDRELLTKKEVATGLGIDVRTVAKFFPFAVGGKFITKTVMYNILGRSN